MKIFRLFLLLLLTGLFTVSCTVENLTSIDETPKTDFNRYNYVLVTEDASDVDITTFFAFNPEETDKNQIYDLIDRNDIFVNSNPSTSSGQVSFRKYIFSQAKDKKGYSSSPGLYRLTLNENNRMFIDSELNISRDNLFPARQIALVNEQLGYFYNEGKDPYKIQVFNPTEMIVLGTIDLKSAIEDFRPNAVWEDEAGNNLIRIGTLAMEVKEGKLFVSIAFLEAASFNLIAETEQNFYVAVIDVQSQTVEKIISWEGARTVGFFVSENKATTLDESGNLYFASWGWNQFHSHFPSQVFRIPAGETDFEADWKIDIEPHFGSERIVQSIISYNNKLYLHISEDPYPFSEDNATSAIRMNYYEVDPGNPGQFTKLDIPSSNTSSRMSVFSIVDDKLYIAVPNIDNGKFNGYYSLDRSGNLQKEMTIANKYRPTRFYKFTE